MSRLIIDVSYHNGVINWEKNCYLIFDLPSSVPGGHFRQTVIADRFGLVEIFFTI